MKELEFGLLRERCYFDVLSNGLPVYVIPKPEFTKAFAFLAVHYGGEDEHFQVGERWFHTPGGVAHYLEHKMFDLPEGNALQVLSARGAAPNAFTGKDITGYYFSCTEKFEENLRTLLKMVSTPYFTDESVEKERGIIGQEIRMMEDMPEWCAYQNLMQALYRYHPIRNSIAGTEETIQAINAEVLNHCYSAFYRPDNMVLCVAGNMDPRHIMQIAASTVWPCCGREAGSVRKDHGRAEDPESWTQEISAAMDVASSNFMLGFKAESLGTLRQQLIGDLAAELLAGSGSPLYTRLYQDGLIDKTFSAEFQSDSETAHFIFSGESRNPSAVAEAILQEGIKIAWNGLDDKSFQRVRKALYGARIMAMNSLEHSCIQIAKGYFSGYQYLDFAEIYQQIECCEVEELLRGTISGTHSALSIVNPKECYQAI